MKRVHSQMYSRMLLSIELPYGAISKRDLHTSKTDTLNTVEARGNGLKLVESI